MISLNARSNLRKTKEFMLSKPEVDDFKAGFDRAAVWFRDGYSERWYFGRRKLVRHSHININPDEMLYSNKDPMAYYPNSGHEDLAAAADFFVSHDYLSRFKTCNQRLFLYRLAHYVYKLPIDRLWMSEDEITEAVNDAKGGLDDYRPLNKRYLEMARIGRLIDVMHTFDISYFTSKWNIRQIHRAINGAVSKKCDLCLAEILRRARGVVGGTIFYGTSLARVIKGVFGRDAAITNHTQIPWVSVSALLLDGDNGVVVTDDPHEFSEMHRRCIFIGDSDKGEEHVLVSDHGDSQVIYVEK